MIYIHVPYCKSHCTYCAFYSELLREQGSDAFIDALCREIELSQDVQGGHQTLYIGGGTPSLLSIEQLERIVESLRRRYGVLAWDEFTIEVNPDDIVKKGVEYASSLRGLGVNRVSMGVQSFDNGILRKMGRRHDSEQAMEAFSLLRTSGFENISIDLIFGFSDVLDLDTIKERLLEMSPEHISCYQLSIEEGSGLDRMAASGRYSMPSDDECESQYYRICSTLAELGYSHYEISNWAKPGCESRHNSAYWDHVPYDGYGPGAHSLIINGGKYLRRWNNPDIHSYCEAALSGDFSGVREGEILSEDQIREEKVMLGLRTAKGVDSSLVDDSSSHVLVPASGGPRVRIPEEKWFVCDAITVNLL